MTKRLSSTAIVALKEALCTIYWYKADLRSFLQNCIANKALVASLNWDNYKRQIVSDLVDALVSDQERHLSDLTKLCHEVASMRSFLHLEHLDGGKQKAERARQAVIQLRELVEPHQEAVDEEEKLRQRQQRQAKKLQESHAVRAKLEDIKTRYMLLATSSNHHRRGFELEQIMYDVFELFDLDPKASFRNTGEQIDGAFSLEGTDYLFEAKWQQQPTAIQDLDAFASKVQRKLDNTLGLFLSINDFSQDAVAAHSTGRPSIVLMGGADLMAVLEERIDFVTLLLRKKRHAAQTGNIYLPIQIIME